MALEAQRGNGQHLRDMNQSQLIAWIESLSLGFKDRIVSGIKSFAHEFEIEVDGTMLVSAGVFEIKEMTGLNNAKAMLFMKKIASKKQSEFVAAAPASKEDKNDNIISFTLNIQGKKLYDIPGATKNWTISKCKYELLRCMGLDDKAELYAGHANSKWVSPNRSDGIVLKKHGKDLSDNVTLGSIGIVNGMHLPLLAPYKVHGGGPLEVNYADWTALYHKCMVCSAKGVYNLSKGYWYHPAGDKAYFTSKKPGKGYLVEMKGNKIRCDGCKKECNFTHWQFKCDNHDYQKIR